MRKIDIATDEGKAYPIRPEHINANTHFYNAFGNMETDIAARIIVQLCQKKGEWAPFTKAEIDAFCDRNFMFHRLIGTKHFIAGNHDGYYVTHEFVTRCFLSAPAIAA